MTHMKEDAIVFLLGIIIVGILIGLVWFPIIILSKSNFPNKPHIIVFETVTDDGWRQCKADDNCMDVRSLKDLPEVDFSKLKNGE